jgi:hypothetical protein
MGLFVQFAAFCARPLAAPRLGLPRSPLSQSPCEIVRVSAAARQNGRGHQSASSRAGSARRLRGANLVDPRQAVPARTPCQQRRLSAGRGLVSTRPNVHKPARRSTSALSLPKHPVDAGRERFRQALRQPTRDRQGNQNDPHRHASQEPPALGLHELAGGPLPRGLARDDPPLDGRRAHQLLPDTGRSAALCPRAARRVHQLDAPRRARRAARQLTPARSPASPSECA